MAYTIHRDLPTIQLAPLTYKSIHTYTPSNTIVHHAIQHIPYTFAINHAYAHISTWSLHTHHSIIMSL
ncbi:hypothetical protein EON63_19325 [archaeon]|nr:MAG: hypothetical protein EON63_19325 [archaeon]